MTVCQKGKTVSALDMIGAERQRQIDSEGWTLAHDDSHTDGQLAQAASVYAFPPPRPFAVKQAWPFECAAWKPTIAEAESPKCDCRSVGECFHWGTVTEAAQRTARIRDLVKAGALIVAEIERLERLESADALRDRESRE